MVGLRGPRRWLEAVAFERRHNATIPSTVLTVNFYPMRPSPRSSMAFILQRIGARIGHSPRPDQPTVAWETGTWLPAQAQLRLPETVLNRLCVDISKTTVDRLWADAAGYSITVDPLVTEGPLVVKPDLNGKHGGRIVNGPIARLEPGMVYQRLVDTRGPDGRVQQLRPVIVGDRIILTYAKFLRHGERFHGTELVLAAPTDELLTAGEQEQVLRFCALINLEYGELDTLRDPTSGRIYVIDANRTPGIPYKLAETSFDETFGPQAEAISALFRERHGQLVA